MFEKIEIERAENGYILHIDDGVPHIGKSPSSKVFTSDRALLKEIRSLLKDDPNIFNIGDFKESKK